MTRSRTLIVLVIGMVTVLALTASTIDRGSARAPEAAAPLEPGPKVLAGAVPASVLVSRELFASAPSAIVVGEHLDKTDELHVDAVAVRDHLPVFVAAPGVAHVIGAELRRLGVATVGVVGEVPATVTGERTSTTELEDLDAGPVADGPTPLILLTPQAGSDAQATARAGGARVVVVPIADPRATAASVTAIRSAGGPIRAVGADFGSGPVFADRVRQARELPELPGGGQLVFPMRRMVALYGSPGAPSLGPLGRQDLAASVSRVRRLAADYQRFSAEPVVPAFEMIVTVASSDPGPGNTYSTIIDPAVIAPWIDAARNAGVYVVLDLQPGRTDFLTQARRYAGFLRQPHVGLALDPEWRLKPGQVHLTQIGSVSAEEVNRTSDWLAALVRDNQLPQKVFMLHEFDSDMLADRNRLVTDHPELQVIIHADGHGTPPVKMDTWHRLLTDLPAGIRMGWKNFYTEDHPTLSPAQTMAVVPTPWFVSYQ